jgi:hypothetical protein
VANLGYSALEFLDPDQLVGIRGQEVDVIEVSTLRPVKTARLGRVGQAKLLTNNDGWCIVFYKVGE